MSRKKLPSERDSITHRFAIGGEDSGKGYIIVGLYEDGTPGEIFIKMDRQGSQLSGFADAWAIAVSILLQSGTTLKEICAKFKGMSFPPNGMTDNQNIRIAKSPIDYIVRWLEGRFIDAELHQDPVPTLVGDKVCSKCESTEDVHPHYGVMKCGKCRSGKV